MAGTQLQTDPITVTVTTTSQLFLPTTVSYVPLFFVDISNIGAGDTWTFQLVWRSPGGNLINLTAATAGLTAVGVTNIATIAPFAGQVEVPAPIQCIATRTVAGGTPTVTYRIVVLAGP